MRRAGSSPWPASSGVDDAVAVGSGDAGEHPAGAAFLGAQARLAARHLTAQQADLALAAVADAAAVVELDAVSFGDLEQGELLAGAHTFARAGELDADGRGRIGLGRAGRDADGALATL